MRRTEIPYGIIVLTLLATQCTRSEQISTHTLIQFSTDNASFSDVYVHTGPNRHRLWFIFSMHRNLFWIRVFMCTLVQFGTGNVSFSDFNVHTGLIRHRQCIFRIFMSTLIRYSTDDVSFSQCILLFFRPCFLFFTRAEPISAVFALCPPCTLSCFSADSALLLDTY
jgi:hypothetical protein